MDAADDPRLAFENALARIGFGLNEGQAFIASSGCTNIAMLGLLSADQISKICKRLNSRAINPIALSAIQEQLLLAMRFWVTNLQRLQQPVIADRFTAVIALNQAQTMRQSLEDDTRVDKELVAKAPDKFKNANHWKVFAEAMETYLAQLTGSGRVPLSYVIRRLAVLPDADNVAFETEQARMIALAPLNGPPFQRDNAKVYGIIKQLVLEGPGRTYILRYDTVADGRSAWQALRDHFEGDGFRNRSVEDAYSTLEHLSYDGERKGFTFEKFVERHMDAYLELERFNEPVLETKKVRDFLSRIKSGELAAAKQQVKATANLLTNFEEAANFIALSVTPLKQSTRMVAGVDTNTANSSGRGRSGRFRNDGRGFRGRGRSFERGRGRGRSRPHARGRGRIPNTGYYSSEDWYGLSQEQRTQILESRSNTPATRRQIAAVDVGREADVISAVTSPTILTPGSPTVGSATMGGNAGHQFGQRSRSIGMIHSTPRFPVTEIRISSVSSEYQREHECYGFAELDSHADTCTVGAAFKVTAYTEKTCNVMPFHPNYHSMVDIPVVQAVTAYTDPESGETFILVINQALFLGHDFQMSLINPNQLRSHGIIVDDCPKHLAPNPSEATHSIYVPHHNLRIPLELNGVVSAFQVHFPSDHELDNCLWVELTSDKEWDPHSREFTDRERSAEQNEVSIAVEDRQIGSLQTIHDDFYISQNLSNSITQNIYVSVANTTQRKHPDSLRDKISRIFGVGLETADRTLNATTQLAIRNSVHPIQRRYRTEVAQLRYPRLGGQHGRFHTDTFFASSPSLSRCTMGQMFTNDIHFTKFYPMRLKSEAPDALISFMQDIGIPSDLHSDDAKELTQGRMGELLRKFWIKGTQSEPYSPWQVRAELCIREIKKAVRHTLSKTNAPRRLWDYCTIYQCELRNLIAHPHFKLQGRTPYEVVVGRTPDISEYLDYHWYQTVWYYDQEAQFPEDRRKLGKWLGVAHRVGQALCYYILPASTRPIVRSTIQSLTDEELKSQAIREQILALDRNILDSIAVEGDVMADIPHDLQDEDYEMYNPFEPEADRPEADEFTPEAFDNLLSTEVLLPKGDVLVPARVISRKRDASGNPTGVAHANPILDTRIYNVQFPDGHTECYAANIIAENIYAQIDEEGNRVLLLGEILGHRHDGTAIKADDKYITHGANRTLRRTTQGWYLQVQWRDGSTSWEPLRNLKESNPVEVAEYAVANKLTEEAAFAWWVPHTLKKRERIIAAIKIRASKRSHKFGLEVPMSVKRALEIDQETGTDLWRKAIEKEMHHVLCAFEILDEDAPEPRMSKRIPCHMIFDIKMDFARKARFVAGGHMTDAPVNITYSSVVARDSVRLAFLIAALNDIDILSGDIGNAYLQAYTKEKVHTICGLEFGHTYHGRFAIIRRALYGLKSSGAAWRAQFAGTLSDLGFTSSLADPDVWMRPATKANGFKYYEYIFVYVDDLLVLSENPQLIMNGISHIYRMKDGSIMKPTVYLGALIKEHRLPDNPAKVVWSMSAEKYVKEAIRSLEVDLDKIGKRLPSHVPTPLSSGYRPELDVSALLDVDYTLWYQKLIGILRWAVELGRIDIHLSVALLAQYMVQPRVGHLDQIFHVFAYLKNHSRSRIILDNAKPLVDEIHFTKVDWTGFYPEATEAIPPNAPEARGNDILMSCFVDADHAGNRITRRSHTGIIIFCNRAPIVWYSKRQNTVETSTFGSEFVAARIAVELIEALRYKLRMFGIPIDGPTNVYCDNHGVVVNSSKPESTLKKKHNSIAYHRVREAAAAQTIRIAKEDGTTNIADLLTKPLPGPRLKELCSMVLF